MATKKTDAYAHQEELSGSTRQEKLLRDAIDLLKLAEPPDGYAFLTSFGKDSIATHRLLDMAGVAYEAFNNHTGIDPPELIYFGRKHYPNVKRLYPKRNMWQLIENSSMPPTRLVRYCCAELKEQTVKARICAMGIRASESINRKKAWGLVTIRRHDKSKRMESDRMFDADDITQAVQHCPTNGNVTVTPMLHWSDSDLWAFIKDQKLPYCCLYNEGKKRLGCIMCPMASTADRLWDKYRWPKYYTAYLRAFGRMLKNEKIKTWQTAEEVMEWWLSPIRENETYEQQQSYFED